jgi:tetratricopeptide (TPR) repeat protein
VELPSGAERESLSRLCRAVWERRGQLIAGGAGQSDEAARTIRTDLLELAAIGADLRVSQATDEGLADACREACQLLDEAEALCGPSFALDARRADFRSARERWRTRERHLDPKSAWEHYELGRYTLRAGRVEEAARAFQRSIELRPQDYWPNFFHGLCSYRLGKFEDAVADFRVCLAIEPRSAVAHYNRALAYDALGRSEEAYLGYSKAIELAPDLAAARLNRGITSYTNRLHAAAIADFEAGLETVVDRETAGRFRFNLALAQLGAGDRVSARENARRAVELGSHEAISLLDELR